MRPGFQEIPEITVRQAWERLQEPNGENGENGAVLIDVRERDEFAEGHALPAVSLPLSELRGRESEVPRDRDVLLICHLGERSLYAARHLLRQGVTRVFNVDGGTDAWGHARLPMAR